MLSKRLKNPKKRLSETTTAKNLVPNPHHLPAKNDDRVNKAVRGEKYDEKYDTSTIHLGLEPVRSTSHFKSTTYLPAALLAALAALGLAFFLHLRHLPFFSAKIVVSSSDLSSLPVSEEIVEDVTPYKHAFELQWGTYRPGLYMGIKSLTALSPNFGLMWFSQQDPQWYDHIRHEATKTDNMKTYYWAEHDGGTLGWPESGRKRCQFG